MTLSSRLMAAAFKLPQAETYDIAVERDLKVPMNDGVMLLAERWYPRARAREALPVILMRTPYGRKDAELIARLVAERGYQFVVQSCRGTFGSGGEWHPFRDEVADGQATLAWLTGQSWFGGCLATWGASYQGLAQWALVDRPRDALKAMAIVQSDADPRSIIYPGGVLALETVLAWLSIFEHQEESSLRVIANALWGDRSLRPAFTTLPLSACDQIAFGRKIDIFQEWLAHKPEDPWWQAVDFGRDLGEAPSIIMVGGWFDLHLTGQFNAFNELSAAGREVRLIIGPWTHESMGIAGYALREGLAWFDGALKSAGGQSGNGRGRPQLRIYLMGSRKWIDLEIWPPLADLQPWHLHGNASLARLLPAEVPPRRYTYDPADPTPSLGGGATIVGSTSGSKDQRARERRSDVLSYTSAPLGAGLSVVGPLTATLYIRADVEQVDLFVRLCDVTPTGRSFNVTDGIVRLKPEDLAQGADGSIAVRVSLWPTAYTFKVSHRLRLQVSSAAHPMYARNTCTGEDLASGIHIRKANVEVFSDPDHPSAIELPVVLL